MSATQPSAKELAQRKVTAHFLIVVKGYSQKDAAELVGVTEKTICKWVSKYHWKEDRDNALFKRGGVAQILDRFQRYVKKHAPGLSKELAHLWSGFLKEIEQGTSNS